MDPMTEIDQEEYHSMSEADKYLDRKRLFKAVEYLSLFTKLDGFDRHVLGRILRGREFSRTSAVEKKDPPALLFVKCVLHVLGSSTMALVLVGFPCIYGWDMIGSGERTGFFDVAWNFTLLLACIILVMRSFLEFRSLLLFFFGKNRKKKIIRNITLGKVRMEEVDFEETESSDKNNTPPTRQEGVEQGVEPLMGLTGDVPELWNSGGIRAFEGTGEAEEQ